MAFGVNNFYEIDSLEGHQFEELCAEVLRRNGFKRVKVTPGSGDYGIDITARKKGVTYAIQCKRYSGNVGNKAVQEAYSGKSYYKLKRAVVLTNSDFTPAAVTTARELGVELWGKDKLFELYHNAIRTLGIDESELDTSVEGEDQYPVYEEPDYADYGSQHYMSDYTGSTGLGSAEYDYPAYDTGKSGNAKPLLLIALIVLVILVLLMFFIFIF